MAVFPIQVKIDPTQARRGGKQVEGQLNRIGNAADRVRGLISRAFAFVGIAVGAREIINLTDTFTQLQNRVRTVTEGHEQLTLVTEELFDIANRTRQAFRATTEVYARTALATKELGVSQRDTLHFVESLNKAVILSGASAEESRAGLIQLSQGLASGTLRGDELRSVLEQLPVVADIIAKSLGVTRGELRLMGEEGRITADIVLQAFQEAREELNERFAKSIPTISQSFEVLRNNVIKLIGDFDEMTKASATASQFILTTADHLDTIGRAAIAAGLALSVHFAKRGVGAAIVAVQALSAAIVRNPIGAIATGITIGVAALVAFSDQLTVTSDSLTTVRDFGLGLFQELTADIEAATDSIQATLGTVSPLVLGIVENVDVSFRGLVLSGARVVDRIRGFFVGLTKGVLAILQGLANAGTDLFNFFSKRAKPVISLFEKVGTTVRKIFTTIFAKVQEFVGDRINAIIGFVNRVIEFVGGTAIGEVTFDRAKVIAEQAQKGFESGFKLTTFEDLVLRSFDTADDLAAKRLQDQENQRKKLEGENAKLDEARGQKRERDDPKFTRIVDDLQKQADALRLTGQERERANEILKIERKLKRDLNPEERQQIENLLTINQALSDQADVYDRIRGPAETAQREIEALNALFEKGKVSIEEYNREFTSLRLQELEGKTDIDSGIERGLLRIREEFTDVGQLAEENLVGAFRKGEDALVEFVETGRLEFGSLVDSIQADLTRLAVRQGITAPLAKALGFGQGGSTTGLFGGEGGIDNLGGILTTAKSFLPGFQHGGSFTVGGTGGPDSQVVAFRATPGEPVKVGKAASQEGAIVNNFNISTPNADSFKNSQTQILNKLNASLARNRRRAN